MLCFEKECWNSGHQRVAGVDEAGRGPLAGPVVAAALVFQQEDLLGDLGDRLTGLNDSKCLTESRREYFFDLLNGLPGVDFGVGVGTVEEIDQINILCATHLAMRRAVLALSTPPDTVLVDGRPVPDLPCPSKAIVKGDSKSLSIAAASVIAKVTRDRMMTALHTQFPCYGFSKHKGYGTAEHIQALLEYGPTVAHRRSFRPVREAERIFQGQVEQKKKQDDDPQLGLPW